MGLPKWLLVILCLFPVSVLADNNATALDLTAHWSGYCSLAVMVVAYVVAMFSAT